MSPWSSHSAGMIDVHTLDHARYGGRAQMDVAVNMLGADKPDHPTIRLWLHNPDMESGDSWTEIFLTSVEAWRLVNQLTDYVTALRQSDWQRPQSFLVRPMRMPQMEYQGPRLTEKTAEQLAGWARTFNVDVSIPPHLRPPIPAPPEYLPTYDPDIVETIEDDYSWMPWGLAALAALVVLVIVPAALIIEVIGR